MKKLLIIAALSLASLVSFAQPTNPGTPLYVALTLTNSTLNLVPQHTNFFQVNSNKMNQAIGSIWNGTTRRWYWDADGHFLPNADFARNIGEPGNNLKNLYVWDVQVTTNGAIRFQNDSDTFIASGGANGANQNDIKFVMGNSTRFLLTNGIIEIPNSPYSSDPAVGAANTARIYYNTTTDWLKVSLNGGGYDDIVTAAPLDNPLTDQFPVAWFSTETSRLESSEHFYVIGTELHVGESEGWVIYTDLLSANNITASHVTIGTIEFEEIASGELDIGATRLTVGSTALTETSVEANTVTAGTVSTTSVMPFDGDGTGEIGNTENYWFSAYIGAVYVGYVEAGGTVLAERLTVGNNVYRDGYELSTSNATPAIIQIESGSGGDGVMTLTATAVGSTGAAAQVGSYTRQATFKVISGVTTQIGATTTIGADKEEDAAWDFTLSTTGDPYIDITVTGNTGDDIQWKVWIDATSIEF